MRNPNVSRVQRLLSEVLKSLQAARAEALQKDRKIVGVLDRLIDEVRSTITDLDKEPERATFNDLFGLLKIANFLVDLLRDLFDTLSCKTNRLIAILDKYARIKCQLEETLKYSELMPVLNKRNWQTSWESRFNT